MVRRFFSFRLRFAPLLFYCLCAHRLARKQLPLFDRQEFILRHELPDLLRHMPDFPPFPGSTGEECLDRVAMVTVSVAMKDGGRAGSVWLSLCALGSASGATPLPRATIHSLQSDTSIRESETGRGRARQTGGERDRQKTPALMELICTHYLMWSCSFIYLFTRSWTE